MSLSLPSYASPTHPTMPLAIPSSAPTLLIRRHAFEEARLTRAMFDDALGLTPEEFRVEGDLIAVGPLVGDGPLLELIDALERAGLSHFDDFFELSGNWPDWLRLFAMGGVTAP